MTRIPSLALLIAPLAAVGVACGGQEVKTEPDAAPVTVTVTQTETVEAGATTEEETTEETTTEEAPPDSGEAGIGDSISLAGYESGYQVTLVKVKNNPPYDEYLDPSRGNRYWAAYIKVKVTDGSASNVCASNDASLLDVQNQTFTSTIDVAEPPFGCPTIAVGKERQGWVTFEIPKGTKLATFIYTPDSGFGEETGEWALGR